MEVNIRNAEKKDMPQVLQLIKELAVFEKEPNAVEVTVTDLEVEGFKKNLFTCFVAEFEAEIVGMALVYFRFSTWKGRTVHLEDLIVKKEYRSKGIGTLLYNKVITFAKQQGVKRVEWVVLDWNQNAIDFYEKSGATFLKNWYLVQLGEEEIKINDN
ncbi:MAG: GNAT family N-acetyltransferase [Flavobacteriaceae bacterium]|mgnify:CR=1 FL=1|nr:GNAT family N-acetyltransferase [Flavobacteriaceae bacterium]|tara:strand:- start:710 stop:1180 length:471 start_codon:yes stop_codon:yes gene_type:complete